jgi:4-hydroxy-3-polyprenylbenzoate decarboxylase
VLTHDLQVPRARRSCSKGILQPDATDPTGYETALEGPFGDHTGYYNESSASRCSRSSA